jgi:hypothetical protein
MMSKNIKKTYEFEVSTGTLQLNKISLYESIEIQKRLTKSMSKQKLDLDNFGIDTILLLIAENFEIIEYIFEVLLGKKLNEVDDDLLVAGVEWEIIDNYEQHPDLKRLVENIKKTLGKQMKSQ